MFDVELSLNYYKLVPLLEAGFGSLHLLLADNLASFHPLM